MLILVIAIALIAAQVAGALPFWVLAALGSTIALLNSGVLVFLLYKIGLYTQHRGEAAAELALEKFAKDINPWALMSNLTILALFAYVATGLWVLVPSIGLLCGSVMAALSMTAKG